MTKLRQSYFAGVTRPIAIVSLGVFINRLGGFFALFLTIIMADRGYSSREITVALVTCALAGMTGAGLSGWLAGRLGLRGALLLVSSLTSCCAYAAAVVRGLPATVVVSALLIAGVQAYGPLAQTVVGIEAAPERKVRMFAVYRLGLNLGATAGPLIGSFLMEWSMSALLIGNGIAATSATLLLLALPTTTAHGLGPVRPRGRQQESRKQPPESGRSAPRQRISRRYTASCLLFGLVSLVYAQQTGAFALGLHDSGQDAHVYGWLLAMNAIIVVVSEVSMTRYSGRWPRRTAIAAGAACVCGGYALNALGLSLAVLVTGVLVWTAGEMLLEPVAAAYASESAPPGDGPRYQALLGLCQSAGMSLGPALGVYLYGYGPTLPWLLCAGALLVTAPGLYRLIPRGITAPPVATPPAGSPSGLPAAPIRPVEEAP
ncbi:MFS transporter [Streptomyces sp. NPDC059272]|uniref:MFS transporter n=1 Tax=Streptomyces sp. NPDC059272 TaxID=3346800 RepID=UPI0036CA8965